MSHLLCCTLRYQRSGTKPRQVHYGYIAASGQPQWVDVRVAVDTRVTVDFYIDGVLQSTATALNAAGKGKPERIVFANVGLHSHYLARTWYFAHIAVLDGISTIGRRFVRRRPGNSATYTQMTGTIDAIKDDNIATRIASSLPGQRMSFTLIGPTGPAANSAIAAVHIKQLTQGGTIGPQKTAGFLRMGTTNFDAPVKQADAISPSPIYCTWTENPETSALWSTTTLPAEVGVVSA